MNAKCLGQKLKVLRISIDDENDNYINHNALSNLYEKEWIYPLDGVSTPFVHIRNHQYIHGRLIDLCVLHN